MTKTITLIPKLIEALKKPENLPFEIKHDNCYQKIPECREHHGEIILKSYDEATDTWYVVSYFVHEGELHREFQYNAKIIQERLEKSFKRGLLDKKFLKDMVSSRKKETISIRLSEHEKQRLFSQANEENLSPSDYVRKFLNLD